MSHSIVLAVATHLHSSDVRNILAMKYQASLTLLGYYAGNSFIAHGQLYAN